MKNWKLLIGCLALMLVGLAVYLIKPWGHFPLNDDWVYTADVLETLKNKHFTIPFGQYAWAIPQILLGLWVGSFKGYSHFILFRGVGLISGVLAGFFSVHIASDGLQRFENDKWKLFLKLLGFGCVFFYPAFLSVTFSFMTDTLAALFMCWGIMAASRYIERPSWSNWAIAFLATLLGVAQRQYLFLVPISLIIIYWRKHIQVASVDLRESFRRLSLKQGLQLVLFLMPVPLIHLWWRTVSPLSSAPLDLLPNLQVLQRPYEYAFYLGLAFLSTIFLPIYPAGEFQEKYKKIFRRLIVGILFITAIILVLGLGMPFYQNILSKFGVFGFNEVLLGTREVILTMPIRSILTVLSFLGAYRLLVGLFLSLADSKISTRVQLLFLFSLLYFGSLFLRNGRLDRYFILLFPGCLYLIYRSISEVRMSFKRQVATGALFLSYFLFSTTLISDYFRWNEARWKVIALALDKHQVESKDLNGGYEFCGPAEEHPWSWKEKRKYPYVVSFSKLPGFEVIDEVNYPSYWGTAKNMMYLLKSN